MRRSAGRLGARPPPRGAPPRRRAPPSRRARAWRKHGGKKQPLGPDTSFVFAGIRVQADDDGGERSPPPPPVIKRRSAPRGDQGCHPWRAHSGGLVVERRGREQAGV